MDPSDSEWLFACRHPHTHYMDRRSMSMALQTKLSNSKSLFSASKVSLEWLFKKWMNTWRGKDLVSTFSTSALKWKQITHAALPLGTVHWKDANLRVFVTAEGGLCFQSVVSWLQKETPSLNTVPSQRESPTITHPPPKRKDFTDRKKNMSSPPPALSLLYTFQTSLCHVDQGFKEVNSYLQNSGKS